VSHVDQRPRAGRTQWIALAVLALPLLLVSMDVSVLYFAVPFISRDLSASATQQLWIFDIYGFVLAGLLITMGALGDRVGRRRVLVCGALAFGMASLAAAYARTPAELIAARAVLGVGGATLMPSTLGLIRTMFHHPDQRAKAIAVWSAVMMGGVSLGPVLAGLLLEHFWWGSVFLINIPAMVLLVVLAPFLLPEFRDPSAGRFDLVGSLLSLAAVLPVIYGIKRAATHGFGWFPAAAMAVGLLAGALFLVRERRSAHPMVELRLFRNRAFTGGLLANVVAMFGLVGNAVFMTQYLQLVHGMSPLRAALWSLVPSVAVSGAAPLATALAARYPRNRVIAGGFVVAAGGFALLTRLQADSSLVPVIVGAGLLAFGLVVVLTLITDLVLSTVTPARAGAASALVETTSEFGGALGIAVLGSIGTAVYGARLSGRLPHGLTGDQQHAARQGLAGAVAVAGRLPATLAGPLESAARTAFTHGLTVAAGVGTAVLLGAALASGLLSGTTKPPRGEQSSPDPATAEPARVSPVGGGAPR
jgi:DHA2 family multidrug resistance protein-like MFS transporter